MGDLHEHTHTWSHAHGAALGAPRFPGSGGGIHVGHGGDHEQYGRDHGQSGQNQNQSQNQGQNQNKNCR